MRDQRNKEIKKGLKGVPVKENDMWEQFLIDGQHRIAELDYITILLKEEGIIKAK